jgi:pilus assembly protein FimV
VVTKKDKYLAAAQKFLERGTLDKALAEFSRAVQEDPKDTRTWLRIAEIHVKRGDNEKATEVYLRTADLYVEQGFFQRAVAVYKNIIKLTPGFVEAYLKLAEIYKQLGLLSDAMQQYEQASSSLQKMGRSKDALQAMRQIVELNPDQPVSRIKLAEAAAQAGLTDEAMGEFERAGDLLKSQGRIDEYLRVAERLIVLRPDDAELAKQVARLYIERNNARFALAKLQASFKIDPRDTETLDLLARAFEQLGQAAKTISVLKELAKVYNDTGRSNERVGAFKRIAALDPSDPDARAVLATRASFNPETAPPPRATPAAADRARRGASITFSELAIPQFQAREQDSAPVELSAPPSSTGERVAMARGLVETEAVVEDSGASDVQRIIAEADVFVKYGLVERAAEHLRKVFDLDAGHAGARERLAAVLLQLGRSADAVAELETLAEQLVGEQPNIAADYARRALDIDARSARGQAVLDRVEADEMGAVGDEIEEISSGMIEMDTPQPELGFDEFGEGTEGEGAASPVTAEVEVEEEAAAHGHGYNHAAVAYEVAPELTSEQPAAFDEFDLAEQTSGDPESAPAAFATGSSSTTTQAGRAVLAPAPEPVAMLEDDDLLVGEAEPDILVEPERPPSRGYREAPRQPVPTPIFPSSRAPAPPPQPDPDAAYAALLGDLEQVDFFLEQGLVEDASSLLADLESRTPETPLIDQRRTRLRALEEAAGLGAVPSAEAGAELGAGSSRPFGTPAITPKAVVSGGGEMDIAAHRDLGIGYKDMGLFDAAIGEFTQLMQDPKQEVFALSMIGECHESKGALGDAVAFYKKALNRPSISDAEATQLYFQLGSVFQTMGEVNEALYFFEKVLKRDAGFRDVRRRISELRGQGGGARQEAPVFDAMFEGKTRR